MSIAPEDELLLHNHLTLPKQVKKFWRKRYDLFSRFDDGVYMLLELWYSVTPEHVAKFTAKLAYELVGGGTVMDVCCGGGGNTIQFARYFDRVIAVDINPVNITCSLHNCKVYQVDDKVEFITGDWHELYRQQPQVDFVFCSPPWGGTNYNRNPDGFDLDTMEPFAISWLIESLLATSLSCGVFLPKTSNMAQLEREAQLRPARLVYVYQDNHCVGLLALFGEICDKDWQFCDEFYGTEDQEIETEE